MASLPSRRLPRGFYVVMPILVLGIGAAGPFDGCDGAGRMDPRPLPTDDSGGCFDDDDCVPAGCEALRCVAGMCVETASIRDLDGDGHAPAPCGNDCDDMNVMISPTQSELCDLVDQDCDGAIDEMAPPRALRFEVSTIDPLMTVVPWGPAVLVTDAEFSPTSVRARRISIDAGMLGTTQLLLELEDDEVVERTDGSTTSEGAVLAIALENEVTSTRAIAILELSRGADGGVSVIGDPVRRAVGDVVTALDTIVVDGITVVGWDQGSTRFLWSPDWTDAVMIGDGLIGGLGPLDLATDGEHVVVANGPSTLAFHLPSDGSRVGTQMTTGTIGPGAPIASVPAGGLMVIVRDAFEYSFQSVSLGTAGARTPLPGSSTMSTTGLTLDVVATGFLLTRNASGAVRAWVFDPTDASRMRSFPPGEISGASRDIESVQVVETEAGTAIMTNFGTGSSLAVLACGATD